MDFWSAAMQSKVVAFDTETTGLDPRHDYWLGFSLAFEDYGRIRSAYLVANALTIRHLIDVLATAKTVVMHNAIFDLNVLRANHVGIERIHYVDTMVAAHMLNENEPVGLKPLAETLLGREMVELTTLIREFGSVENIPHPNMAEYAARDAECTLRLWRMFEPRLQDEGLNHIFHDVEMPNLRCIADMEWRGIMFDIAAADAACQGVQEKADELLGEIEAIVEESGYHEFKATVKLVPVYSNVVQANGKTKKVRVGVEEVKTECPIPFKVTSTQQLGRLLFEHYGLEPVNGDKNVRKETLSVLADKRPDLRILNAILEYRKLSKLLSTYYKPLVIKARANDGVLHTHFNPCGTVTSRSSSSDPNLQNAPRQKDFRNLFIARPGYLLGVSDLSQAELRVTAHESQDPMLLKAYREKIDVHQQTADGLGIERYVAKTLNFALLYGMGAQTLQTRLWSESKVKITLEEAEDIKARWYQFYAGVKPWQESVKAIAHEQGYVVNMYGRKRRLPHINSENYSESSYSEREAVNFMIQSVVAHIIKVAKINFMMGVAVSGADVHLLLEVHDELVVEAPAEAAQYWADELARCMTNASSLCVPIPGEAGVGSTWGNAKK